MLKPVIKVVSFLFCIVMPVNGVESSGMEPFLETTTFLDEDMLLTIPDVHVDPTPTSSQESFSSNITNASPSNPRVIPSTQKISEVASGEHPVIQSKENLTETYFPWKRSDNQSKMPILFLLIGICLPLLMISILMVYLCYKHRKTRKCSTNLSYLWRTEEGTEYSEALSTPDSPSELGARSDSSVCYVNMNLNNNAVRSGRVYPSLIGNNAVDSVRRGDLEEVHQLMFMNVSFKGEKDLNGWSVLHIAVYNHDVLMLKMLLEGVEEGLVDLLERNNDGQSPIVFAASLCNNQLDCVALLIDALSDVRNCNITIEGQSGNKKQLPLLGENINEWALVDDLGRNVIHYSSLNNSPQAILFFASFGADVNYIDFRGDSPLHLATREGHGPSVQALLDCGVKTDIKNADGIEPIAIAENRNFSVLADKLRRASVEKPLGRRRQRRRTTAFPTSDSTRGSCDSGIFHHDSFRSESGSKRSSLSFSSDLDLERCQSSTYVPGYEIGSPTEAYQEAADLCFKNYSRKRTFLPPLACDTYDEFFTPSVILPTLQQTESESFPASLDSCETDSCTDSSSVSDRKRTQAFGESQDKDRIALGRKFPPFSARMHTFKPSNASEY